MAVQENLDVSQGSVSNSYMKRKISTVTRATKSCGRTAGFPQLLATFPSEDVTSLIRGMGLLMKSR